MTAGKGRVAGRRCEGAGVREIRRNTFIPRLQFLAIKVCGFLEFFQLLWREFGLSAEHPVSLSP